MKYFKIYIMEIYFTFYPAAPGDLFVNLTFALLFRWHLVMFCVIITDIWWGISNSCMARGWSAFLRIFHKNCRQRLSSHLSLLIRYNTCSFWRSTSANQANRDHYHSLIRIPILYVATTWSILSARPIFWL